MKLFIQWVRTRVYRTLRNSWLVFKYSYELKIHRAKEHGTVLMALNKASEVRKVRCNHLKGGNWNGGTPSEPFKFFPEQGDSTQYAVIKHRFSNGDIRVSCLRCCKKWLPGDSDYEEALKFPTKNTMSESFQFYQPGSGGSTEFINKYRELIKDS